MHKCPFCLSDLDLDEEGLFPYHDHPKPLRRICSGARKTPEQANEEFKEWLFLIAHENGQMSEWIRSGYAEDDTETSE